MATNAEQIYTMVGAVYHHGNQGEEGHYTARVRGEKGNDNETPWWDCNDKKTKRPMRTEEINDTQREATTPAKNIPKRSHREDVL